MTKGRSIDRARLHRDPTLGAQRFSDGCTEAAPRYNPLLHEDKLPVRIRKADEGDVSFIYSSWLKSYAAQNKDQPKFLVYDMHREVVSMLLQDSVTIVACMNNDNSHILGWLCAQRTPKFLIAHYCYIKEPFRKFGIARSMLDTFDYNGKEPIVISHKGYIIKDLKDRYTFMYVPHLQKQGALAQMEEIKNDSRGTTANSKRKTVTK